MKIIVAKTAGFCMGVRRAVEVSLDAANTCKGPICTYGPLIHNPQVLDLLEEKGISAIAGTPEEGRGTILIRAHGVPPDTKDRLERAGYTIIDATCPRVIKVQTIIRKHAERGHMVVIIGDKDHPEVIGLLGYAGEKGVVVDSLEELENLPSYDRAIVVAQTTQNSQFFSRVREWTANKHPHYKIFNTICDSTEKRQAEVNSLAKMVDAMIVVGGRNSGNTQRLAEVAREAGRMAFHIESEEELDLSALADVHSIGITAGASTPNWVINKVYKKLEMLPYEQRKSWRRVVYPLQRALLLTNLYVALGAGCLSYACALLQRTSERAEHMLIAFLYVLAMHTFNNLTGVASDRYNNPDRATYYQKYRMLLYALAIVSGAAGLVIAFSIGWLPFYILFAMSVLGGLYNMKVVPSRSSSGRYVGLKDIPGSKTVLMSLAWGVVAALFPVVSGGTDWISPSGVLVFLWASGLVFVQTAFFDMLDMQGDRIVGKETIPLYLGDEKTLKLLKATPLVLAFLPVCGAAFSQLPHLGYLLGMVSFIQFFIIAAYEKGLAQSGIRLAFLIDSVFIWAGVFAFFGSAAGLV